MFNQKWTAKFKPELLGAVSLRKAVGLVTIGLLIFSGSRAAATGPTPAAAQSEAAVQTGTSFTYQGKLQKNGQPTDGSCDFQFSLWDAAGGGAQQGEDQNLNGVQVSEGLFAVALDFGDQFKGEARWLEAKVKCPGDATTITLSPRFFLAASPYALSLRPGASIIDDSGGDGLYVEKNAANSNAIHGKGTASGSIGVWGEGLNNTGVFGSSQGGNGVWGRSTNGYGLFGFSNFGDAIHGETTGGKSAVYGQNDSTDERSVGVWGRADAAGTFGVYGSSASGYGVWGESVSGNGVVGHTTDGNGVWGHSDGGGSGVYGVGVGGGAEGVFGKNDSPSGIGVYGRADSPGGVGVHGKGDHYAGVYGTSRNARGVWGESDDGTGVFGISGSFTGVWGFTAASDGTGVRGESPFIGVQGSTSGDNPARQAIRGENYGSATGYAGYFNGNVDILGTLSKSAGSFTIDHPLDPANKTLSHSFVESPDMMNIYNGTITLDEQGAASVTLPDWFEALNQDFRYQLTAIGGPGPNLYIAQEITGNRFAIAGGAPGLKVSWQVTGIRHDPYAEQNRILVEEVKSPEQQGKYVYPQGYGQPLEMGTAYLPPADASAMQDLTGAAAPVPTEIDVDLLSDR